MIVTDIIGYKKSGGQIYSYFNLKKALTQGVELSIEKKLTTTFRIQTGYQFLYSADKEMLAAIRKGKVYQRNSVDNMVTRMQLSELRRTAFSIETYR